MLKAEDKCQAEVRRVSGLKILFFFVDRSAMEKSQKKDDKLQWVMKNTTPKKKNLVCNDCGWSRYFCSDKFVLSVF